jgi:hypothetical protein
VNFSAHGKEVRLSEPAAYTEEQARHWLWFLAHNMQTHGQSMFMLEQLQPSWLLSEWQVLFYLLLSRIVMLGTVAMLVCCCVEEIFFSAVDVPVGLLELVGSIGVIGLVWALLLFLRTSNRLPGWFQSLVRGQSSPARVISSLVHALLIAYLFLFRIIVWPVYWVLLRNGRTLNDDIQPVERISWSWINFLKGFAFISIKPSRRGSSPLSNLFFPLIFWTGRILWFAIVALVAFWAVQDHRLQNVNHGDEVISLFILTLPSFFCAFFSAISGKALELKTAPNMGILLSGRNALIAVSINFVLALIAKLIYLKWHSDLSGDSLFEVLSTALIIAGALAWGRLGGLDFLAHYCLRFVLQLCGYIPRDYVRFLNYAATDLGFLQKVGGGYVFMHRYLLEYFASSEQGSAKFEGISTVGVAANG